MNVGTMGRVDEAGFFVLAYLAISVYNNTTMGENEMQSQGLSISSKVCTLRNADPEKGILDGKTSYVVPVYQRPYEWDESHVETFMTSLLQGWRGEGGESDALFLGTIQISPGAEEGQADIIDGQQRLTTLLLIAFVLNACYPVESADAENFSAGDFGWLKTRVENGKEQDYFDEVLAMDAGSFAALKLDRKAMNAYKRNAVFIRDMLASFFAPGETDEGEAERKPSDFIRYIREEVYFAVLRTETPLSKTLEIFRAINTTGLPLKENDVFKIRFYEYLRDVCGRGEEVFDEINGLYRKIEDNNASLGFQESSIDEVLEIYKYILIASYQLPDAFYGAGTSAFYERLFDTLSRGGASQKTYGDLVLSIPDIDKVIDARYAAKALSSPADKGCFHFIHLSRYAKYWILAVIYRSRDMDRDSLSSFLSKLCRLYVIYSLLSTKALKDMKNFTYELVSLLVKGDKGALMDRLDEKLADAKPFYARIKETLRGDISLSSATRNLVLELSLVLHEADFGKGAEVLLSQSSEPFFLTEAFDAKGERDDSVWNMWGAENINSLGNMVPVEKTLKAQTKGQTFSQKLGILKGSALAVARDLPSVPTWTLADCKRRKDEEAQRILNYLFA
jgi:hypothetical protein